MCTAISFKADNHYFGRNLDLEFCYNERVTITPRNYTFKFRKTDAINSHYAIIGVATVEENYPLYYDATNEKGLSIAGLNFPENAFYSETDDTKINIAPFELIPYILSQCKTVEETKALLKKINLAEIHFSKEFRLSPLHWIIADKTQSITLESVKEGMKVYDNPVGVLTNNPGFDMQMFNLNNYMSLSKEAPKNSFSDKLNLKIYSRGMGAMGLPGDLSSQSRFVKAVFTKYNSVKENSLTQFFHILHSVEQQKGCVLADNNKYEYTMYTSCCNTDKGIYYYTTYENHSITAVDMHRENLDAKELITYPLIKDEQISEIN